MLVTNEELEKLLKMVADCEASPRFALSKLGYYFDSDLYMEFIALQNHQNIDDPALKKALMKCEKKNRINGCYKQDYNNFKPEIRKYLIEDEKRIREMKL